MASSLKTPEPFSFGASDLAAQWGVWRRQFEWYLVATRSGLNVDEEQLVGVLLTLLGAEGLKIYESFVFALAGDGRQIVPVLDRFTLHFEPRRSEVFERFKFLKRHQLSSENFDSWLIELRTLIKSCGYGVGADSVLRDQIVLGVADPLVREKLLFEKDLLLIKACDIVRACESSKAQLTQFGGAQVCQIRLMLFEIIMPPGSGTRDQYNLHHPDRHLLSTNRPVNALHLICLLLANSTCNVPVAAVVTRKINVGLPTFAVMVAAYWAISSVAVPPRRVRHLLPTQPHH